MSFSKPLFRKSVKKSTLLGWKHDWITICDTEKAKSGQVFVTKVKCNVCEKHVGKITAMRNFNFSWVSGTCNVKKDSVETHCNGEPHKRAVLLETESSFASSSSPPTSSKNETIDGMFSKVDSKNEEKLTKLFNTAFMIAKEELPFVKFNSICDLQTVNGLDLGETYINDHACAEFIDNISEVYEDDFISLFNELKYFSILVDGSTDTCGKEKEIIYILYLDPVLGKPVLRFFSISTPTSQAADGIFQKINETFKLKLGETYDLSCHLVGFGADGASVNFGKYGGLVALFKQDCPWLVGVHCVSHRLELAIADALEGSYMFKDVDEMIQSINSLYRRGGKKLSQLSGLAKILGMNAASRPAKTSGTRWLEHKMKAFVWMSKNYAAVMLHLAHLTEDTSYPAQERAKFKGMYNKFRDARYPLWLDYYIELLSPAARLSVEFQREDVDVVSVVRSIKTFFQYLDKLQTTTAIFKVGRVPKFFESLQEVNNDENDENLNATRSTTTQDPSYMMYHTVKLLNIKNAKESLSQPRHTEIVKGMAQCFHDRFDNVIEGAVYSSLLKILDTEHFPTSSEELSNYGDHDIQIITSHFEKLLTANECNLDAILYEWTAVKDLISTTGLKSLSHSSVWQKLFLSSNKQDLTNILHLVTLLCVIPISNAILERMFSAMSRVHTDWRNGLGEKRVENLLRVMQEGPEEISLFDPTFAIQKWNAKRIRRPNVVHTRKGKKSVKRKLPHSEVFGALKRSLLNPSDSESDLDSDQE